MPSQPRVQGILPASDLDRAQAFYRDKLGWEPAEKRPDGVVYEGAGGTSFLLYTTQGSADGSFTQLGFSVDDLDATVAELKENGVVFEEYDTPELKTENSIANMGPLRAAWFRDSEGNMIGVGQEN